MSFFIRIHDDLRMEARCITSFGLFSPEYTHYVVIEQSAMFVGSVATAVMIRVTTCL